MTNKTRVGLKNNLESREFVIPLKLGTRNAPLVFAGDLNSVDRSGPKVHYNSRNHRGN